MSSDPVAELPATEVIIDRLAAIQCRIDDIRQPDQQVTVVAVTKTFPALLVDRVSRAGLIDIGENYAQDLVAKAAEVAERDPVRAANLRWHFIGGLQRNKVKLLAPVVDLWHTIDRDSLVNELAKRQPGASILIQVNTTNEPQKSGCVPAEVPSLVDTARTGGLNVTGLMTIGPGDGSDPRPAFDLLRRLGSEHGLVELSMGMSGDYDVAVEHGATIVRIGSGLFGSRRG